jgi:hypothetical protein
MKNIMDIVRNKLNAGMGLCEEDYPEDDVCVCCSTTIQAHTVAKPTHPASLSLSLTHRINMMGHVGLVLIHTLSTSTTTSSWWPDMSAGQLIWHLDRLHAFNLCLARAS